MLQVNSKRLIEHLESLGEIGRMETGGVSRVSLSKSDFEGRRFVLELMREAGLSAYVDAVANVVGVLGGDGESTAAVVTGSHGDSVVNGGNLDGGYGVIAAIECAQVLKETGMRLKRPLVVVDFTNEEGVRFPALTGSMFFAGLLSPEDAYHQQDMDGNTLGDALADTPLELSRMKPPITSIVSYVELHIEQGGVLEESRQNIGVVNRIVGIRRYDVTIKGSADHAGTTPLNLRRDCLLTAARVIVAINQLAKKIGGGAVGTVGQVRVSPNQSNVVAGEVRLTIDFRHGLEKSIVRADSEIRRILKRIAAQQRTPIEMTPTIVLPPTNMAPRLVRAIGRSASELGLSYRVMPSGAGHDAVSMSKVTQTGMIFVPSRSGRSHSPMEFTNRRDLVNGSNVLLNVLAQSASR